MRVREVMSSPVVCVPPEMPLKEVADLLVREQISAVPVVEGGELVGLISEADLVPLELALDPGPTSSRRPSCPATFRRWPARR
ncbi:MAG TPA: CBS domain-containing protein [Actinomycetota bacterium]